MSGPSIADISSPDAPTVTNSKGGSQSLIPVRFDLIDAKALFEVAKVLYVGARKYGEDNWRKIPIEEHINHNITHAYAYLAGDRSDEHLSHMTCRSIFAQGVALQEGHPETYLTVGKEQLPPNETNDKGP